MYHAQAYERCFFFSEEQKISCPITLVPVQHIHTGVHVCLIHKRINLHPSSSQTHIDLLTTLSFSTHVFPVLKLIIELQIGLPLYTCKLLRGYM